MKRFLICAILVIVAASSSNAKQTAVSPQQCETPVVCQSYQVECAPQLPCCPVEQVPETFVVPSVSPEVVQEQPVQEQPSVVAEPAQSLTVTLTPPQQPEPTVLDQATELLTEVEDQSPVTELNLEERTETADSELQLPVLPLTPETQEPLVEIVETELTRVEHQETPVYEATQLELPAFAPSVPMQFDDAVLPVAMQHKEPSLDFGVVETPTAVASGVQTVTRSQASNTVRRERRNAAGAWWLFLPLLLLLPLVGWLGWRLLGGTRTREEETEALPVASVSPTRSSVEPEAGYCPFIGATVSEESVDFTPVEEVETTSRTGLVASRREVEELPVAQLADTQDLEIVDLDVVEPAIDLDTDVKASTVETSEPTAIRIHQEPTVDVDEVEQSETVGSILPITTKSDSKTRTRSSYRSETSDFELTSSDRTVENDSDVRRTTKIENKKSTSKRSTETSSTRREKTSQRTGSSTEFKSATSGLAADSRTYSSKTDLEGVVENQDNTNKADRDDFTRIYGIDSQAQQALYNAGYLRYSDIEKASEKDLKRLFSISKDNSRYSSSDFSSWASLASMARRGDWKKLEQENAARSSSRRVAADSRGTTAKSTPTTTSRASTKSTSSTRDDLTKIRGIGPATAKLLRREGITTFRGLNEAGTERLQEILTRGGSRFKLINPSQWSQQARFAMGGDWTGLTRWQSENAEVSEATEAGTTAKSTSDAKSSNASTESKSSGIHTVRTVASTTPDDLTRISGISPATAKLLRREGITTFRGLYHAGTDRLQEILTSGGSEFKQIDSSQWTRQARFAMGGDWTRLTRWQSENAEGAAQARTTETSSSSASKSRGSTSSASTESESSTRDDLTKIRGIGPATVKLLRREGITTFRGLNEAGTERLQGILTRGGSKFKLINPSQWTRQARFAMGGDWTGLTRWQSENVEVTDATQTGTTVRSSSNGSTKSKSSSTWATRTSTGSKSSSTPDDLTKIRGIGPATAKLLRRSGITTFSGLYEAGTERLQGILTSGGSKFKLIDPSQWTQQARFAMGGDWTGLTRWQSENLVKVTVTEAETTVKTTSGTSTRSKSSKSDDLKRIRGIGPATQRVLRKNGIVRFEQVAKMSAQQLNDLFANMQSRFQLLDTSTWPTQAEAFASGLDTEVELLNEINSIRDIASSSSPAVEKTSKATSEVEAR